MGHPYPPPNTLPLNHPDYEEQEEEQEEPEADVIEAKAAEILEAVRFDAIKTLLDRAPVPQKMRDQLVTGLYRHIRSTAYAAVTGILF